ncbi:MAG: serine/threonine protein kinase [Gemmatales bacterium]|nr:serine/threonine protein kinase [Gemmatales bacterium]MDW8385726.1 serine/threonine-protein kinase [Gemmatales bacterium]
MRFAPGSRLGDFEILERLGVGAMGEVYRARDLKLGREVALKTVRSHERASDALLARFRREAQVLAAINHPNIAAIYSLEESSDCMFLVMELVPGQTLADVMHSGLLPPKSTVQLALQIAEGLAAAHNKGIIHRDLKPSNIKVTPEGRVKILDFGLAKSLLGTPWSEETRADPGQHVTQEGVILGTPAYMSPEQAAGKPVDKRTDIWSFGVMLFEMCSGTLPFTGETTLNTIALVLEREPDWSRLPRGIPQRLRDLIQRCLRKDPARRLQDIGDAALELEAVRDLLEPRSPGDSSRAEARSALRSPALDQTEVLTKPSVVPSVPSSPSSVTAPSDPSAVTTELVQPAPPTQVTAETKSVARRRTHWALQTALYSILGILVVVLAYALYDLFAPRDKLVVLAVAIPGNAPKSVEFLAEDLRNDLFAALTGSKTITAKRRQVTKASAILAGKAPSELGKELGARWLLDTDLTMTKDGLDVKISLVDVKMPKTIYSRTYRYTQPTEDAAALAAWRKEVVAEVVSEVASALESKAP